MNQKTIRLVVPDWQSGDNPVYTLGAKILSVIAPENPDQKTVTVPVNENQGTRQNGVNHQDVIKENLLKTKEAIAKEAPDRIITLGGNCFVSQAPIDYLNGVYHGKLGVIWLDAHPDISNPTIFDNEHAMVAANLLHKGDPALNSLVDHPLQPSQIYYAGIQTPTEEEQKLLQEYGIEIAGHHALDISKIKDWAKRNQFDHIYLHFDIDVLDPRGFYATYFNNPKLTHIPENAAKGDWSLHDVFAFIQNVNKTFSMAGMTIAEYMPWSAQQLRNLMKGMSLFTK